MGKDLDPDDAPFEIPKFDEDEFVRKELLSFRTTVVLFVFSLLVSLVTFFVWRATELQFFFLLVFALAFAGALPFIYKTLRIDISHWKRNQWIGNLFLHFFFWMGFTLLLMNPPFTDNAAPVIQVGVSPAVQVPGEPIAFGLYVADNDGIRDDRLVFCVLPLAQGAQSPARYADVVANGLENQCDPNARPVRQEGHLFWTATVTSNRTGDFAWYVVAEDKKSLGSEATGLATFGDPFKTVEPPRDDRFSHSEDAFKVCPRPAPEVATDSAVTAIKYAPVRVIQFSADGGTTFHNFVPDPDPEDRGCWETKARYQGWARGNATIRIQALYQPVFLGTGFEVPARVGKDPDGPYRIAIDARLGTVGEDKPGDPSILRYQPPIQTPGLEAAGAVAALGLALAWVARRKRRHA